MPSAEACRGRDGRGFSLAEMAIALALLALVLASLAPILVRCTVLLADARDESRALALAVARIEQLAALPYEQDAVTLAMRTDESTNLAEEPPAATGSGLLIGSAATAWRDSPDLIDWRGPDGRIIARPGEAVFLRRWAVSQVPGTAPARLLQVVVRSRAREQREGPRVGPARRPGDVWLFTVRAPVRR